MNLHGLKDHSRLGVVLPVLLAMLCGTPAMAFQFNLGEVNGSLDSTLSYGLSWRVGDQDKDLIGLTEGGNAYSHNGDDGNLNYDKGDLISNTVKVTSDLTLDYNNFGLFFRGSAFYDFESEEGDRSRTPLSNEALDLVGSDIDLLDAYGWWNFEAGDVYGQLRVGDQVLSWGESTFIQNGINVINPFDVSKLRVPGSELKEGLVPVGMVSASVSPTDELTFEAFYQYDWQNVEIDPPGSYWSTNDFAGDGGNKVMLAFADVSDLGTSIPLPPLLLGAFGVSDFEENLLGVPRLANVEASDDGQYGLAMRVVVPKLNDTEFGFYFMNYHSRLPIISGKTGTAAGVQAAQDVWDLAAASIVPTGPTTTTTPLAAIAGQLGDSLSAVKTIGSIALDKYTQTAGYFLEYPEDLKLYGMSFNTQLSGIGVALQGEISYRPDAPAQIDDIELLLGALTPMAGVIADLSSLTLPGAIPPYVQYTDNQMGLFAPETIIHGFEELDISQAQVTATQLFGPTFGANQFVLVGEVGVTYVHDMPSKRLESQGTYTSGNDDQSIEPMVDMTKPLGGAHKGKAAEPADAFADATSWGYRMVGKLDFNNAVGAVTLSPRVAWAHDVSGNSPGPGGNFIDGRKAITLGLGASYQATWSADLSYTDFFGAGRYNLVNDRDFVALNIKYSF